MDLGSAPEYGPGQTAALRLPSWGSLALRRSRQREATHTEFASPGCAAPSGFLSLLTLSSSRSRPALFHAGGAHGLSPSRGLLLPRGQPYLSAGLPLVALPGKALAWVTPQALTGHPVQALQARAQPSGSLFDFSCRFRWIRASEDARPRSRPVRSELTFRGLSHAEVRASIHRVLPRTNGADPLLGFHLPRVFSRPATAAPHCVASSHALRLPGSPKRPRRRCLRVSVSRTIGLSLTRRPTLPRFPSSSSHVG